MAVGFLYRATSPSGKQYVGITSGTVEHRWRRGHVKDALRSAPREGCCRVLDSAIRKYGPESLKVETLVVAEWSYLQELEKKAIVAFVTKAPNGYNLTDGGDGLPGIQRGSEWREKLRRARKGKKNSAETCRKIGDALRGRKRPEHSKIMTGRKRPGHAEFMRNLWAQRRKEQ